MKGRLPSWRPTVTTAAATLGTVAASVTFATAAQAQVADCADPTMLVQHRAPGAVTLMCTGDGFPTRSASTTGGLAGVYPHPAFAPDGWPQWAAGSYWAPDLERVGDQYVLYFSAARTGDQRHCIGVATSSTPDGGFHDVGQPLVSNEPAGAIDPALLRARGRLYLLYKIDGNAHLDPAIIYGRPLAPSGLEAGRRKLLLRSRSRGWEEGVVEGPTAISKGRTTYLLYSGGIYTRPGYAQGEAIRTGRPLGLYHRVGNGPVLRGSGRWRGTGGGSAINDKGRLMLAYSAFRAGERRHRRRLFVRPLRVVGKALLPVGRAKRIALLA